MEQTISRTTTRAAENTAFRCFRCGTPVLPLTGGSFRNHCPECLWSVHVDIDPGDRAAGCGGPMRPVGVEQRRRKGLVLAHRCERCGHRSVNRLALDEPGQPDSAAAIGAVMNQQ